MQRKIIPGVIDGQQALCCLPRDATAREAVLTMRERQVGAVMIVEHGRLLGIVTERDVLRSIGNGQDPDTELVADHLTTDAVYAAPDWSLDRAALSMVDGGFRHLIVVDGGEVAGVLSVRDIIRCWTRDGASCDLPG